MTFQKIMPYWHKLRTGEFLPPKLRAVVLKWPRVSLATVITVVLLLFVVLWKSCSGSKTNQLSYYTAKRGDFLVSVVEGGSLRAVDEVIIRCEVEGTARIISIVGEGTVVKKGELLIELDSSEIQDKLGQQEIAFENAKFSYVQAEQQLSIQKSMVESNTKDAELKTRFAFSDLEKYVEGDWPQVQKNAQTKITIAKEELQRAKDRLDWTEKLEKKGYATKTELEADKLASTRKVIEVEQATEDLRLLEKYDFPKRKALLEANAEQLKMDLERLKQRAVSSIAQYEADLETRKRSMDLHAMRLEQLKEQLSLTKIYAPQDGLVVYASNGNNNFLVEEGATVRQRQELIKLPDVSSMLVDVKVHETFVNNIAPGLLAYVTIDSIPDKRFIAGVRKVAPLPDTQSRYMNPNVKVYSTEVVIEDKLPDVKPGVSAKAEIVITNLSNVISIPLQAVTTVKGKTVVYLAGSTAPTPVEVGHSNDRFIEIKSGVAVGQQVLLSPPITGDSGDMDSAIFSSKEIDDAKASLKKHTDKAPKATPSSRGNSSKSTGSPERVPKKDKTPKPPKKDS
ncbi:MAG TPA: efflux RND transporter periplasmic adaptor subunit [Roseimicrobium sp.]|nr:efflux RND transporter periplasmic adaptor subunit [Roseimicrobium sp.]